MRILGIDPGLAIVGWGVIESARGNIRPLAYGAITTPAHTDIEARLLMIERDLTDLIEKYQPRKLLPKRLHNQLNNFLTFDRYLTKLIGDVAKEKLFDAVGG